jgi:uncharacterized membrane protein YqjE
MTDQQQNTDTTTQNIAQAIQEVSERASLLVREEIELAKVEVTEKITKLIKGAVVGIAAGIFVVFALIYLLHGFAWLAWYELFPGDQFFWGFFVVAAVLLLLGALAGYIAARAMKSGAPPTPVMAIDEAKLIKDTVQSKHPERTI